VLESELELSDELASESDSESELSEDEDLEDGSSTNPLILRQEMNSNKPFGFLSSSLVFLFCFPFGSLQCLSLLLLCL